jgi:hypothetical protein
MHFHKKSDVDGSGKCTVRAGGNGVHFAIYEIALTEKPLLDSIEGLGKGYDDLAVALPGIGNCQTYVAREEVIDDSLAPMDWYKALVLLGCRAHDFPDEYVNQIEAVSSIYDPDIDRWREQWQLIEAINNGSER